MDTKNSFERKSKIIMSRGMYIDDDNALVYCETIKVGKQSVYRTIDRIPFNEETRMYIVDADEWLHRDELSGRYDQENADYGYINAQAAQENGGADAFNEAPIDRIADPHGDVFSQVFPDDEEPEAPVKAAVRKCVDGLSEKQQDVFYGHFGECKQLEEMRAEESAATGKPVTQQAMSDRKKKLMANVKKAVGHFYEDTPLSKK